MVSKRLLQAASAVAASVMVWSPPLNPQPQLLLHLLANQEDSTPQTCEISKAVDDLAAEAVANASMQQSTKWQS